MGKLALHDRSRTDWTKEQWSLLFEDYLEEFQDVPVFMVEMGMTWLKRNGSPWFPSIPEIHEALKESEREWMANWRRIDHEEYG